MVCEPPFSFHQILTRSLFLHFACLAANGLIINIQSLPNCMRKLIESQGKERKIDAQNAFQTENNEDSN